MLIERSDSLHFRTLAIGVLASVFATVAMILGDCAAIQAAIAAHVDMTYYTVTPSTYRYRLRLSNDGTTNIGTLWYAWAPGEDYMFMTPTKQVAPTGWTPSITHSGAADGYAALWQTASPLAPGAVLEGFGFDSPLTPDALRGKSPFFPSTDVGTTFAYAGAPLIGTPAQFTVTPVDNPWHNPWSSLDVDDNGTVVALDALLIINSLNSHGNRELIDPPSVADAAALFLDTSNDQALGPLDALLIINFLNAPQGTSLEVPAALGLAVPEPSSAALMALAFVAIATVALARRPSRRAAA